MYHLGQKKVMKMNCHQTFVKLKITHVDATNKNEEKEKKPRTMQHNVVKLLLGIK